MVVSAVRFLLSVSQEESCLFFEAGLGDDFDLHMLGLACTGGNAVLKTSICFIPYIVVQIDGVIFYFFLQRNHRASQSDC